MSAPSGSPLGYLVTIGGKDKTLVTDVDNLQITIGLNDRQPQIELSIYDDLCQNPVGIMDEVVIIDQATLNPTQNFVVFPTLADLTPYYIGAPVGGGGGTVSYPGAYIQCVANGMTSADAVFGAQDIPQTLGTGAPNYAQFTIGQAYCLSGTMTITSALSNAAAVIRILYRDAAGNSLATFTSALSTSNGRMSVQGTVPANTKQITCEWGLQGTNASAGAGTIKYTNLQFEPVWFPYLQNYPTPLCASGQAGCYVLPNGTTIRQNRIFAGIVAIADPGNTSGDSDNSGYNGPSRTWDVRCKGPNWILDSIRINATYTSQQDYQIITSIASSQLAGKLTTNNVEAGITVDQRAYDYSTFTDVITDLCNTSGFTYYADNYYDLHYIAIGSTQAPYALSDSPDNVTTFPYEYWSCPRDGTQIENAVIVKGGDFTGTYTDTFTADGSTKQFTLTQSSLVEIDTITVNGTEQTKGIDGNNNFSFSNSQVLMNFPGHFFRFQNNVAAAATVICTYKYKGQVRVSEVDLSSVAQYKGVKIWGLVSDSALTTTAAAVQRALEYLNEHSTEAISPHFKTLMPLYPGQIVNITNSLEGFSSKPFLVQQVTIVLMANGVIEYEAQCGNDIPDWVRVHHRLNKITTRSKALPGEPFSSIGVTVNDSVGIGADSISVRVVAGYGDGVSVYGTAVWG